MVNANEMVKNTNSYILEESCSCIRDFVFHPANRKEKLNMALTINLHKSLLTLINLCSDKAIIVCLIESISALSSYDHQYCIPFLNEDLPTAYLKALQMDASCLQSLIGISNFILTDQRFVELFLKDEAFY